MPGSRIFWKLYAGFALVILLAAGAVLLLVSRRVTEEELADIRTSLEERARILERVARFSGDSGNLDALQARVLALGEIGDCRYTIIDAGGTVLADSDYDPARMEPHGNRPELRAAMDERGPASSTRYSRTLSRDLMYVAVPAIRDGEVVGALRAALPLVGVEKRIAEVRANVVYGAVVAAALALVLSLLLTRFFTRRLTKITDVAEEIAGGTYAHSPLPTGKDEIGKLAFAVERMSSQLEERLAALTTEKNGLRAILSSMMEGVVAVDREERIVLINGVAARILGSKEEESLGRRVWELTRIQELNDALSEVLGDAAEQTREVRLTKAFRERVIELQAAPLKASDDTLLGAVLVLHDVTELRRLEEVRQEFVANVSHELKTPLTAIRGFVETLLDDGEIEEKTRRRFLQRVLVQTLRISTLVSDLLVLSRVESEEEALERQPVDLRSPVRESARRFAGLAGGGEIGFEQELPEEPVVVLGDEEGLRQVVDNLLDNAFKYTPDGGSVRLALRREGDDAVIEVRDTGIGIETRHIGRIFERFYRVDKARSRELGGTGLGLAIVKHLVAAHGGEVLVESVPGEGSSFRVVIPLCREA